MRGCLHGLSHKDLIKVSIEIREITNKILIVEVLEEKREKLRRN